MRRRVGKRSKGHEPKEGAKRRRKDESVCGRTKQVRRTERTKVDVNTAKEGERERVAREGEVSGPATCSKVVVAGHASSSLYISMLLILSPAPPKLLTCILPPAAAAAPAAPL